MKAERDYQPDVKEKLLELFPGCVILKNDSSYIQGIPDLSIFYKDKWAMLEVKKTKPSVKDFRPNQEHYLQKLDTMSFARVIFPENMDQVFKDLVRFFKGGEKE